jgi:hypothetical protein
MFAVFLIAVAATAAGAVEPVFTDVTEAVGVTGLGAMLTESVAWGDFDNDGDPDLYLTNDGPNRLYRNDGGVFTDVTAIAGVGDDRFGVGTAFADLDGDGDLDGWMDFVVTNGFDDSSAPNVLFLNRTRGSFRDATVALGGADFDGRGAAFADYDRDGDLDLVITGDQGATRLRRNDTSRENDWLGIRLIGSAPNTTAIGARVEIRTPTGASAQEVSGGAGRGSQNDQALLFGLGGGTVISSVTIRWPDGSSRSFRPPSVDRWYSVTQHAAPRRPSGRAANRSPVQLANR